MKFKRGDRVDMPMSKTVRIFAWIEVVLLGTVCVSNTFGADLPIEPRHLIVPIFILLLLALDIHKHVIENCDHEEKE